MHAIDASRRDNPLSGWDPETAWLPWQPGGDDPWDLAKAAHLWRRAAFGFPAYRAGEDAYSGLQRTVAQGLPATLVEVFAPADTAPADTAPADAAPAVSAPAETAPANATLEATLDAAGRQAAQDNDLGQLTASWLYRMIYSPSPLTERMTLFWHGHFATSVRKVNRLDWMFEQNALFRQHALGKFGPLLAAVGRDRAMAVWLDAHRNVKGRPNENYARELMELFSLGEGNYTERDVQEAARALTGARLSSQGLVHRERLHDNGEKTLLGQTGAFNADDVPRILLEQPAAALFLIRKLFRQFVSETAEPPDALLAPLADEFRNSGYDVRLAVERIVSSRLFFSPAARRARIKSPVEYIVGAARGLGGEYPTTELAGLLDGLGQDLFAPPNVKGWDGGESWLNTALLLARHNAIWQLLRPAQEAGDIAAADDDDSTPSDFFQSSLARSWLGAYFNPAATVKRHGRAGAAEQVALFADLFLAGDIAESTRSRLIDYLQTNSSTAPLWDARVRETLHAMLLLPEYHLA